MEPSKYPHPTMPNVRLWDLPGIGSTNFKAKDYLKKVKFNDYDFFIIVSSTRFGENDLKLATEIQKNKKLFYFVRLKIDNDVQAEKKKPNFNLEMMLAKIKKNCEENLKNIEQPKVFLVSSFELEKYDFQELVKTLENDLPEHKQDALVQSLPVCSLEVLMNKKKMFLKFAWAAAYTSAAIAVVPIPGLSVACDVAILVSFLLKCYHAFDLNENSLKTLSERTNKPVGALKAAMKSDFHSGIDNTLVLRMLASGAVAGAMVLEYALSNIPIVGSLAAGGISFATTFYLLKKWINEMAEDAKTVLEVAGLE